MTKSQDSIFPLNNPSHHNPLGSLSRAIPPNLKISNSHHLLKGSEAIPGEGFAVSLVLGHCRLHREWGRLWTLVAHHSWIDTLHGNGLGLPKWQHRVELIPAFYSWASPTWSLPIRWEKTEISQNQLSKVKALFTVGNRARKGLTLSGSDQPNHSHTITGSLCFLQTVDRLPPQSKDFVTLNPMLCHCQEGINFNFRQAKVEWGSSLIP